LRNALSLFVVGGALIAALAASPARAFSLESCLASAHSGHPTLAAARAQSGAARARAAIARASYLPSVTLNGSFLALKGIPRAGGGDGGIISAPTGSSSATLFAPPDFTQVGGDVTVRQTLFDFGRLFSASESATETAAGVTLDAARTLEIIDVEAEIAFRTALASVELVDALKEAKRLAEGQLTRAQARAQIGLAPQYDVTRADVELANAELSLVTAENAIYDARIALAEACGLDAIADDEPLEPAPFPPPLDVDDIDARIEDALARRPEVRAAEARVRAANLAYGGAWTRFAPQLDASANIAMRGTTWEGIRPGWQTQLTLTFPLFLGGADLARVDEARANADAARANLEAARRRARIDAARLARAVKEARARRVAAEKLVRAAVEAVRIAEGRANVGSVDALVVADAVSALAQARASDVRARLDELTSAARLQRLLAPGEGT
jgi:outer membrane protein TolC